uniref:Uncharacterized protein LOC114339652 n=1 Tax=Diabrotica virgifera virgifera TaxID=50390 RepID=A0A6P7GLL9_DIAVI
MCRKSQARILYGGLIIAQITSLIVTCRGGDIQEMVSATYLTLTNAFSLIKVGFVYKHRTQLLKLIDTLNREEFQPRSDCQRDILKKYIKLSKLATAVLLTISMMTCCFWAIYPFTMEGGPFLPLVAYIPYNIDKSPNFELTYVGELIGIAVSAFCCLSTDTLITGLYMVLCAQCMLLCDSLINIEEYSKIDSRHTDQTESALNTAMIKNLRKCVKQHICILKFAEKTESIFTVATFGQFIVSVLILCTTLFKLSTVILFI